MKKGGQFYLIAGMIIISLIIGLIAIVNYTKTNQPIIINDIKEELKIETQKVLENEASQGGNPMNTYGIDYSSYLGSEIELYFIKGSNPNIEVTKYINGDDSSVTGLTIDDVNDKIIFNLNNFNHEFDLMPIENFYYLISQEIKGEYFVAIG
ncbi:hypothetical protein KAI04_03725 [Candidatus Pacearchaeota archaeon]|nr:hypothetical protein [Candidatus Pacearchaeota archaeon]